MLDILKTAVPSASQWNIAIEGMRNSWNSWDQSDSLFCKRTDCSKCEMTDCGAAEVDYDIGINDLDLMTRLSENGGSHSKFRRMLPVWVTINAPLYWWKEFDTYKVGTVCNSCSTMHTVTDRKFTVDDFSHENLLGEDEVAWGDCIPANLLIGTVDVLNDLRNKYLKTKDKKVWENIIKLLPSSYNQRRTVMLNYEVLAKIFAERKDHKLSEWHIFCEWVKTLPYSELITAKKKPVCPFNARF